MITIEGRKMGKSYNNVVKLTELFSGSSPVFNAGLFSHDGEVLYSAKPLSRYARL
jgi:hypothetical protein